MSEMTLGSDETPATALNNALVGFTGCIGAALTDVCSYGLTIGDSYVPFDPDPEDECEDGEVVCTQAWVRVDGVTPETLTENMDGHSCVSTLKIDLEVGVLRCIEVPEGGEAPTATDVLLAAMQAMEDMNAILDAALNCEVWSGIEAGVWSPMGPQGGQAGGTWTFTAEFGPTTDSEAVVF